MILFDGFRLDAYARTLAYGDVRVALRPRTFALLEYFVRHPGRTLSKAELFDALWPDEDVTEGNLSQHVFTLRAALARHAGSAPYVVTEPRRGYRFVARAAKAEVIPADSNAQWLYLRGRFAYEPRTRRGLRRSIGWFRRALAADPSYAAAYAGLGSAYALSGEYLALPPSRAFPRAGRAAMRALALDPGCSEACAVMGEIAWYYDHDAERADRWYRDADAFAPRAVAPAVMRAWFLCAVGRAREAERLLADVIAREPCSLIAQTTSAVVAIFRRRFGAAAELLRAVLDIEPAYVHARYYLAMALQLDGDPAAALAVLGDAPPDGYEQQFVALRGALLAALGRPAEARVCERALNAAAASGGYLSSYNGALLALALGDRDAAFTQLERGLAARDPWSVLVPRHPQFDALRGDARFAAFASRIGTLRFDAPARAAVSR
jgi:DNA-binding winged helix-turn-helix (wHTH) protein/Tfp pilus assembly protein PilF